MRSNFLPSHIKRYHECFQFTLVVTVCLFASAAVGLTVPAADIQQRGQFIRCTWRRSSEQAGPHQGLQRQSQGARPQKEAAGAVQLSSRCCRQEQRRKTHWDEAVRGIPTGNIPTTVKQQTVQRPAHSPPVVTPVQLVVQVKLPEASYFF